MPNVGTARGFSRSVNSRQRLVRLIEARIDGTGTASVLSGSKEVSLTDNGVGDYTLTFAVAFRRVPNVQLTALGATFAILQISVLAVGSVRVLAFDAAGAPVDTDFHALIIGSDAADEV